MNDQIEFRNGQFVLEGSAREKVDALLRRIGQSGDTNEHKMLATTIIGPIKQIADYTEWTKVFWQTKDVGNPAIDVVRIAQDAPSMIAVYTSPTGDVEFVRPGRTTFVSPSYKVVEAGLEIGWDDMVADGWNILERKMREVAEELARKRDAAGKVVLDAAAETATGHNTEVSGGSMTKAGVDAIFKLAAKAGWKISKVVVNTGTIMDMGAWTFGSATHLWQNIVADNELMKNFFVSGYGGATWYAFKEAPTDRVYFTCTPEECGAFRWRIGGTRTASDIDIVRKTDLYSWDEKWGHYWGNNYAVWAMDITA